MTSRLVRIIFLMSASVLLLAGCNLGAIGFPGISLQQPQPEEPPADPPEEEQPAQQAASADIACPIGKPRTYSDTFGAPRSGGRRHEGVDMLASTGTRIFAYEDGVISRMSNNTLGGITLNLQGDSGDEYYYAHLSGYVDGLSTGQRVAVGEHIALSGDTGNAAGIPHLHFEVHPNGDSPVNPFPYAQRACG
jgi:murein DD-endopeptidase MepM/ murein hydrolase activator NlpD